MKDTSAKPNFFELLKVPQIFDLSEQQLKSMDRKYQKIQSEVHPDKFVNKTDEFRAWAFQQSATANEAIKTLKNKLLRAKYILQLNGYDLSDEATRSAITPEFLMEQLEWREAVYTAYDDKEEILLEQHLQKVKQQQQQHFQKVSEFFAKNDFDAAKKEVICLMFYEKLESEIVDFLDLLTF